MFPIRDDNPTLHTSFATFTIIGLNILAWIMLQGFGTHPALAESICEFGLIPGEFLEKLSPGTTISLGNQLTCVTDPHRSWFTPLSSMFMHGSWFHLIINMWFFSIFGDNVEDAMGIGRFFVFYLVCGFGAVAVQLISDPSGAIPMVGASGAIGGVMGAYALLYPKAPVHMLVFIGFYITRLVLPAYFMLGYWFLLQLLGALPATSGTTGGVAFWAHIGGFITGIVLVKPFCNTRRLEVGRLKRSGGESKFRQLP
jgi:membrane associated rhomboid family serine protease